MTLDIFQQALTFALLANGVNDKQDKRENLESALKQQITDNLKDMNGWEIAWGPAVWKLKPDEVTYPANSWYILYHPNAHFEDGSYPTYLIAIAGTPFSSKDVIDKEDNAVDTVVNFNAWVTGGIKNEPISISSGHVSPGIPYIAKGAAWGTFHLVNTKSSEGAVSPGQSIVEYFGALDPSPSTRFIVTGHSLGGALTTTLALTLVTAWALPAANTRTYPAAGFSTGNVEWARMFADRFPPSKIPAHNTYKVWNRNLVNNSDIFPQLWCHTEAVSPKQWIGRLSTFYDAKVVQKSVDDYMEKAQQSGVVYKPIPSLHFDPRQPPNPNPSDFDMEAFLQHCNEYSYLMGLEVPSLDGSGGQQTGAQSSTHN